MKRLILSSKFQEKNHTSGKTCPMCLGTKIERSNEWSGGQIAEKYKRVLGMDVGSYFNDNEPITLHFCKDCTMRFFTPATIQARSDSTQSCLRPGRQKAPTQPGW